MRRNRAHIPCATKLASALLTIVRPDGTGKFVPVISYEEAQKMTASEIISRFRFDHYPVPHSQGGPDHHSNLVPRPTGEHEKRTAEIDIPQIAKTKRISKDQEAFRSRLLAKDSGEQSPGKTKGRPMPGSRSSGLRKRMNGTVERRS